MIKKDVVVKLLKDNSQGLTIQDLFKETTFARNTITQILAELTGEKSIIMRRIGQAKLYIWSGK